MKETIDAIIQAGFSVVACLGLAWFINKKIDTFQKAIENNTLALTALLSYIKDGDKR